VPSSSRVRAPPGTECDRGFGVHAEVSFAFLVLFVFYRCGTRSMPDFDNTENGSLVAKKPCQLLKLLH
jgi:hypothetical protein